jgi:RNA-binding protein YhbY
VDPNITGGVNMEKIPLWVEQLATSRDFHPTVRIGKSGLTEHIENELKDQLASKNVVKVKINKGLFEKKDIANLWNHLATVAGAMLVLARGNVAVFYKK